MAFAASALTTNGLNRAFSIGPVKVQIMTWAVASADVSGTITATALSRLDQVVLSGGLSLTSAPTYATNVATLAFVDPAATLAGSVICIGV